MAVRLGTITLNFAADTKQFMNDLHKTSDTVNDFAKTSSRRLSTLGKDITMLEKASGLTKQQFTALNTEAKKTVGLDALERSLKRVGTAAGLSTDEMKKLWLQAAPTEAKSFAARFQKDATAATLLGDTIKRLGAIVATYFSIQTFKEIASLNIKISSLEATFTALTGSTQESGETMRYILNEADRLGQGILQLTQAYKGYFAAGQQIGFTSQTIRNSFEAVTEASTVLNLSADDTKLALYALEQMMGKGKVSMEELRRQLGERIPGAFAIAARSMGVTTQEFDKMVSNGEVFTDEFLPKFSTELRKTFGPGLASAVSTPRAEIQRFMNELVKAEITIGKGGFLPGLAIAAKEITASMKTEEWQSALAGLGRTLGELVGIFAKVARFAVEQSKGITSLVAGYVAYKASVGVILPLITTLGTSMMGAYKSAITLRSGVLLLDASLNKLKGASIITLALSALASFVVYFKDSTSPAIDVSTDFADALSLIAREGKVTSEVVDSVNSSIKGLTESQARLKLIQASSDLATYRKELMAAIPGWTAWGTFTYSQTKELSNLANALTSGKIGIEAFTERVNKIALSVSKNKEEAAKLAMELEGIGRKAAVTNALKESLLSLLPTFMTVKQAAQDTGSAIESMLSPKQVQNLKDATANLRKEMEFMELGDFGKKIFTGLKAAGVPTEGLVIEAGELVFTDTGKKKWLEDEKKEVLDFAKAVKEADARQKSLTTSLKETRVDYKVTKYLEDAKNAVGQLGLEADRVTEQLAGKTSAAMITKIEKDAQKQIAEYRSILDKIAYEEKRFTLQGAMTSGRKKEIEEARKQLNTAIDLRNTIKNTNIEIAVQNELLKSKEFESHYEKLLGNVQRHYHLEADILRIQREKSRNYEQHLLLTEQIRQAQARANMDFAGIFETGIYKQTEEAVDSMVDLWESKLPGAFSNAADAIGSSAAELIDFSKDIGDAWKSLGDSFKKILQQMVADFISAMTRMTLFGGQSGGGLVGMLGSAFGGLFTGGAASPLSASESDAFDAIVAGLTRSAKGNIFGAGTGFGGSIVTSPTFFNAASHVQGFAKGGTFRAGVMGEAGPEAVVPLDRDAKGRLGLSQKQSATVINIEQPKGMIAETRRTPTASGGERIDIAFKQAVNAIVTEGMADGKYDNTMSGRFGLSRLVAAY